MRDVVHPTRSLQTGSGESINIDVEMYDLIASLWAQDIPTVSCCQGGVDERASVQFASHSAITRALAYLYDIAPDSMRSAIAMGLNEPDDSRWEVKVWTKLWWQGGRVPTWLPDGPDPLYYALTIPRQHLAELSSVLAATTE